MRWTMRIGEDTDSKNTIKSTYSRDIMMIRRLRGEKRHLKDQCNYETRGRRKLSNSECRQTEFDQLGIDMLVFMLV